MYSGGMGKDSKKLKKIVKFNPETKQWVEVGEMKKSRYQHSCVKYKDGSTFLFGGSAVTDEKIMANGDSEELEKADFANFPRVQISIVFIRCMYYFSRATLQRH